MAKVTSIVLLFLYIGSCHCDWWTDYLKNLVDKGREPTWAPDYLDKQLQKDTQNAALIKAIQDALNEVYEAIEDNAPTGGTSSGGDIKDQIDNIKYQLQVLDEFKKQEERKNDNIDHRFKQIQTALSELYEKVEGGQGKSGSGNTYTRWGKTSCPSTAALVYEGYAAGNAKYEKGGGANFLCLPKDPEWRSYSDNTSNLAQHKQTQQSSLFKNENRYMANKVVDGIYTQNLMRSATQCSHTSLELQPWWAVDLEAVYSFDRVVVFGRTDCCAERLSNFTIDAIRPCNNHSGWFDNGITTRCSYEEKATEYVKHICHQDTIGRYVRIQISKLAEEYLTLCEVEVHGTIVNVSHDDKSTADICDESTTTVSTTSTKNEEPPENNTLCFCPCKPQAQTSENTPLNTQANEITPLDTLVIRIKEELSIDKKNTSAYKRSKISQRDTRVSSMCIGVIGSVIIAVPVISIITCDIMNWFAQRN